MYLIKANFYDDFYIYKDDILIMTAKRKYFWFSGVRIKVINENTSKLILTYRYFSFFMTIIKIKYQNLPHVIKMAESILKKSYITVNNHQIGCRLKALPQREMGVIEIDNVKVARITNKKIFGSSLEFEIDFHENNKLEIYCILFFLMSISTIESF